MLQSPIDPACSVSVPPYRWRNVGWVGHRLTALFNRGGSACGYRDTAENSRAAFAAFLAGRVSMRMVRLPREAVSQALKLHVSRYGTEGKDHARLKAAALLWMRSEGAEDAAPEVRGIVGIADAYSAKANWIVECGHTRFSKLADAMSWEDRPRFTLLPFQPLRWNDGRKRRPIAIDFSWSPEVTADVVAEQWAAMERCAATLELDDLPSPSISGGN